MASAEVFIVRLSEAERDALIAKLDEAAARLGTEKVPKMAYPNGDGTWDVGCSLDGEPDLLRDVQSCIFLRIALP